MKISSIIHTPRARFLKALRTRALKETRLTAALSLLCLSGLLAPVHASDKGETSSVALPSLSDTTAFTLDEIEVSARRPDLMKMADGSESLSADGILLRARTLGEADFITALKMLPGVSSGGDYGSGLVVDGAAPSQSLYRLDGVPVIFPYRFGGIFSTFNPYHFRSARFERFAHGASFPSRLGADADMISHNRPEHLQATLNLGLISSSAGARIPAGKRLDISVAGRISYLDLLYGSLLKMQDTGIAYDFADINLTANYRASSADLLQLNLFFNHDHLTIADDNYAMDLHMKWHNSLVALSWLRSGDLSWKATVYHSGFGNTLSIQMPSIDISLPSAIRNAGMLFALTTPRLASGRLEAETGIEANLYSITPQYGKISIAGTGNSPAIQNALEIRPYADIIWQISDRIDLKAGISIPVYTSRRQHSRRSWLASPSPRATLSWHPHGHTFRLHAGYYTQFLHQTGFSEMGLASNFWTAADSDMKPQRSQQISAEWSRPLFNALFTAECAIYYKHITGQTEYQGDILEIINNTYDVFAHIVPTHGYNYGMNLAVRRDFGRFTGIAGYSFGVARRKFSSSRNADIGWFDAITSPGHSLDVSMSLNLGPHWSAGARFVFASGRVYTPVEHTYIIAGNIARQYAPHNSSRLPSYQRLDLSANYTFRSGGRLPLRHNLNISLLNAYGHKNVEMIMYSYRKEQMNLQPRRQLSLYRFLPSISYSISIE